MKGNNNKQQIIKNQIRDKISIFMDKVRDQISNKKYLQNSSRYSQGNFMKTKKKFSNN